MTWITLRILRLESRITKRLNSEPFEIIISHESFEFFRYKRVQALSQASVYTEKIQVTSEIFLGIPLESDSCQNSRITEDVRNIKSDLPRGKRRLLKMFHVPN